MVAFLLSEYWLPGVDKLRDLLLVPRRNAHGFPSGTRLSRSKKTKDSTFGAIESIEEIWDRTRRSLLII
ncbi:hypothetical protein BH20ACI3_BH20ACI3_33370 [soil metagenome]